MRQAPDKPRRGRVAGRARRRRSLASGGARTWQRPAWLRAAPGDWSGALWAVPIGCCLAVILAYVALTPPPRLAFDLAAPPADVVLRGFYGAEQSGAFSFRWARPEASLGIPVGAPGDYRVTLALGDNPALARGRTARVYANGREVGAIALGEVPREVAVTAPLDARAWGTGDRSLQIELATPELIPPGDPRPLGPLVTTLRVEPIARRLPSPLAAIPPYLALLGLALWLRRVGVRRDWAALVALSLVFALAVAAALRRADVLVLLITIGDAATIGGMLVALLALLAPSAQPAEEVQVETAAVSPWPARLPWLCFAAILVGGALLRGYRLVELAPFLGDQARDVLIVRRMLLDGELPTLGSGASTGNFSRGPAYLYLLAVPFLFAGGHAVSAAALSAIADCGAITLLYLIGRRLASPWAGLAAAGLWAVAPLVLVFARMGWNPNPLPCFALLIVYGLLRLARGDGRAIALIAPAWSVAWQLHDQALLLLPPIALLWLWLRPRIALRHYAIAVALTAFTLIPYLAGEVGRGFANTRAMVAYIVGGGGGGSRDHRAQLIAVLGRFDALLPGSPGDWLHWTLRAVAVVGLATVIGRLRARATRPEAAVAAVWLLVLPLYAFWPGPPYYHYFLIGLPLPFLLLGFGVDHLRRACVAGRPLAPPIGAALAALILVGAIQSFVGLRDSPVGTYLTAERAVDRILAEAGDAPFAFRYAGSWAYDGMAYQYLFAYRGRRPAEGAALPTYALFTPQNIGDGLRYRGTVVEDVKIVRTDRESPQAGLNLLIDDDFRAFRQLPTPSYVIPTRPGWSVWPSSAALVERDAAGRVALCLGHTSAGRGATADQEVAVEPGQRYRISYEYRAGAGSVTPTGWPVHVLVAGASVAAIADPGDGAPTGAGWARGSFVAVVPPGVSRATVRLSNPGAGDIWLRAVELRQITDER